MHWFHNRGTLAKLLAALLAVYAIVAAGAAFSLNHATSIKGNVDEFDHVVLPGTLLLARSIKEVHQVVDDTFTLPKKVPQGAPAR